MSIAHLTVEVILNEREMKFKIFCALLSSGSCSHGDAIVATSKAYADFQTAWDEAQPQEKRNGQPTADNSAMLKCTCYSSSFCSEGNYYLVRNDCPVHKGTLSSAERALEEICQTNFLHQK